MKPSQQGHRFLGLLFISFTHSPHQLENVTGVLSETGPVFSPWIIQRKNRGLVRVSGYQKSLGSENRKASVSSLFGLNRAWIIIAIFEDWLNLLRRFIDAAKLATFFFFFSPSRVKFLLLFFFPDQGAHAETEAGPCKRVTGGLRQSPNLTKAPFLHPSVFRDGFFAVGSASTAVKWLLWKIKLHIPLFLWVQSFKTLDRLANARKWFWEMALQEKWLFRQHNRSQLPPFTATQRSIPPSGNKD